MSYWAMLTRKTQPRDFGGLEQRRKQAAELFTQGGLPAYAPDLNPTEGVWNNIKSREMANLCPELMLEAAAAFRRGLQRLSHTRRLPFSFLQHTGLFF